MQNKTREANYRYHPFTNALSLSFFLSDTHSAADEAPNMASRLLLPPFLQPFRILRRTLHAPLCASSSAVPSRRRRRILVAPLRRAGEDRRLLRRPQSPRGVAGVSRVVRGAAAAAGGHGAAPLGEALQARPPRRPPQRRQGPRLLHQSRRARLRPRHGRRRPHLLGARREAEGHGVVS